VPLGVTKVNIDTDGRLVWTRVQREYMRDNPTDFDFRKPGALLVTEYATFIVNKSQKLLSAGTLADVRGALS
jgi:fructose-bisphosphate aldolase class II